MAKPNLEGRKFFQSSGKVNWVRFIPLAAITFLGAILLAGFMAFLFNAGFYLVVIVPLLVALGLAGLVLIAVRKGNCRSRLVGGLLGVMTGTVLYLGYFYFGMVHDLGLEYAGAFEVLPHYIDFRMKTTVTKDVGAPDREGHEKKPRTSDYYFNWVWGALEFGFILCIAGGAGIRWARRPYCERCQMWMKRESTTFKPEIGPGLVEALRQGSAQSLAALFTSPQKPGAPHTAVAIEYCPNFMAGIAQDCPICLSIKQVENVGKALTKDTFDQSKGKMLVRQTLVDSHEVAALLPRFTSLEKIAGTTAVEALKELQVEVKTESTTKVVAEIRPVDPEYAGKVLTTKTGLIATAYALLGIVGVFGPIALGFLGGMLAFPDHPPAGGVSTGAKLAGEFIIGLAILAFVVNMVMLFMYPDFFATRYLRRLTLRELMRHPRPFVSPEEPAALFVQVIPRANWAKLKLLDPSDIGFLRVDTQRGELLFEGDKESYRIPGAAITACDIELFIAGEGSHGATKLYRVVLQINHPSGEFWEVPFAERGNSGKFRHKMREKWARNLQQQIQGIMFAR